LVHISALSDNFVKDPHTVVKAGQVVKVKVLEVDEKRKRISLTMRLTDSAAASGKSLTPSDKQHDAKRLAQHKRQDERKPAPENAMAAAFAKLGG
jgi:uncharacterized protein